MKIVISGRLVFGPFTERSASMLAWVGFCTTASQDPSLKYMRTMADVIIRANQTQYKSGKICEKNYCLIWSQTYKKHFVVKIVAFHLSNRFFEISNKIKETSLECFFKPINIFTNKNVFPIVESMSKDSYKYRHLYIILLTAEISLMTMKI